MPYIKHKERRGFGLFEASLEGTDIVTPGQLNYVLTLVALHYIDTSQSYEVYNAAIGALECAKLELYRRRLALLEDAKIKENGDVYD